VALRQILESKTNGKYYFKHVQFQFSDRLAYNLWEKTKAETLSAVYTKNQNSKICKNWMKGSKVMSI
jgi:hypothetical protein